jgi:starch phosphorylase
LDLISSDHFNRYEPCVFVPLSDTLLARGDHYMCMHPPDLNSYLEADRRFVAGSGKFSSDRTIAEYAADIWEAKPCPMP